MAIPGGWHTHEPSPPSRQRAAVPAELQNESRRHVKKCPKLGGPHFIALSVGNQLAMGSSTGGLWISENGGDHWDCLSNHLPQIYTVRFSRES
jgi:hypothetical protein